MTSPSSRPRPLFSSWPPEFATLPRPWPRVSCLGGTFWVCVHSVAHACASHPGMHTQCAHKTYLGTQMYVHRSHTSRCTQWGQVRTELCLPASHSHTCIHKVHIHAALPPPHLPPWCQPLLWLPGLLRGLRKRQQRGGREALSRTPARKGGEKMKWKK